MFAFFIYFLSKMNYTKHKLNFYAYEKIIIIFGRRNDIMCRL